MPALHAHLTAERRTAGTPAGPVTIRATVDPRKDPAWERLVAGPRGSVFGSPVWISAIADTYGFDVAADVCIDPDGRPVAGLACTDVSDFRGVRQISLPFCDYLDPVLDSEDHWNELVGPRLARGLPLQLRVLEPGPPRHDPRFEHVGELIWHATDLERDQQEILAGFHPQARQNLRSARRRGVSVRFGTSRDDMRAFHELHRRVRKRKYRLLAQPASFFDNIWERFAAIDAVTIGLASHEGVVIAGAVYLFWRDVMYYKFGASIAERLVVRPNELLAWESIRLGVAARMPQVRLGCERSCAARPRSVQAQVRDRGRSRHGVAPQPHRLLARGFHCRARARRAHELVDTRRRARRGHPAGR